MNVKLLETLFADPTAYAIVEQAPRRERGHADIGVSVPAYGPDAT